MPRPVSPELLAADLSPTRPVDSIDGCKKRLRKSREQVCDALGAFHALQGTAARRLASAASP